MDEMQGRVLIKRVGRNVIERRKHKWRDTAWKVRQGNASARAAALGIDSGAKRVCCVALRLGERAE